MKAHLVRMQCLAISHNVAHLWRVATKSYMIRILVSLSALVAHHNPVHGLVALGVKDS